MIKAAYTEHNYFNDLAFIKKVEGSPVHRHLNTDFNDPSILNRKITLLKGKYSDLNTPGGSTPIEQCSNPRVSRALKKIYEQTKKNVTAYRAKATERMDATLKKAEEIRNDTSLESRARTIVALRHGGIRDDAFLEEAVERELQHLTNGQ